MGKGERDRFFLFSLFFVFIFIKRGEGTVSEQLRRCERANERWWLCGPCEALMVRFERPGVGVSV